MSVSSFQLRHNDDNDESVISLMRSENRLLSWIYNFQFMLLIAHSSLMKGHANKSPWTGNCSGKRHVDGLPDGFSLYCLLGK